jgi:serine/threonine-protein kinase
VTARTSAFAFRGSSIDIRTICRTLGVQTILEGSVRRAGTRIRVSAQLIDADTGLHVWSERYDRELIDVFAVQDEIAEAIVGKLRRELGASARAVVRQANLDAYDAYLRGRYYAATVTPDAAKRARAFFEQAIALDPSYAPAHTGLARSLLIAVQFGVKSGRELMPQMKAAALRAVALDDQEAEAHAMLGIVAGAFDYDWAEALRRCRLALACKPAPPTACHMCAQFILIPQRRFDEAVAVLEPVLIADPLAPLPRKTFAEALFMGGLDQQRAIDELQRLIEWDDRFWLAHFTLANIYAETGMTREAIAAYEKGLAIAPFPPLIGGLASVYARAGDHARAEGLLRRLDAPEHANNRSKSYMFFHLGCSELDRAADYLAEMIEARDPDVIWLGCHRSIDRLRRHARFSELLGKMDLARIAGD